MSSLNVIETARVVGVLGEALDRLSLVSSLPPRVAAEASKDAGGLLINVLTALEASCLEYSSIADAREAAKAASLKVRVSEATTKLGEISRQMRAHLRGLTRVVRESSDQRSELAALLLERSNLVELLEKTAREVDEVGAYSVLSAANAAEVSARASSSRLLAKEAEVAAALKLETAESEREAKEASEAIQRRRADTSALASKLALLRETDSHTLRLARKDKSALIEAENYSLELAGDDAADVAAALSEKLRVEKSVGEAIAEEYKVQIADLEARRDVWKAKTAADVISIKADIETLTGERDTVHAALLVAQARYEADLAEAKTAAAVSGRGRRRASSEANFSDTSTLP